MNRRAEHRRRRRLADKGWVDPQLYARLDSQRVLPDEHPRAEKSALVSTRELGMELLGYVRRVMASEVQERLNSLIDVDDGLLLGPRPGPKSILTFEALWLAALILASLNPSYKRSDLCRVLIGLHPDVALEVGLIDEDDNLIVPSYSVVAEQALRLEKVLRDGWAKVLDEGSPDEARIEYDLQTFVDAHIKASIPKRELEKIQHLVLDDTNINGWAALLPRASEKDVEENDPWVDFLKKSVDDPDAIDPAELTSKQREHIKDALAKGFEIGPDGRAIYTADKDARAGYKSANSESPAGPYVGYVGRIAVACQPVDFHGDLNYGRPEEDEKPEPRRGKKRNTKKRKKRKKRAQTGSPLYVVGLIVDPAGTNPGPAGVKLVELSRGIVPNVVDITADRGFTMKKTFARELHKMGLNVFMDYPKQTVDKPRSVKLGKKKIPAFMHCGTLLSDSTPAEWLTPPKQLRGDKALADFYVERADKYRFSAKQKLSGGRIQFRTPTHAGRLVHEPATLASGSYRHAVFPPSESSDFKTTTVLPEDLDHWQRIPFGTWAWLSAYAPARAAVETAIASLKEDGALKKGTCKAMGLAANTLAVLARTVIQNLEKTKAAKREAQDDASDDGQTVDDAEADGTTSEPTRSREDHHSTEAQTRAPP